KTRVRERKPQTSAPRRQPRKKPAAKPKTKRPRRKKRRRTRKRRPPRRRPRKKHARKPKRRPPRKKPRKKPLARPPPKRPPRKKHARKPKPHYKKACRKRPLAASRQRIKKLWQNTPRPSRTKWRHSGSARRGLITFHARSRSINFPMAP